MRRVAFIAVAATLAGLSLLAEARAARLSQESPSGQERVVVFETFGQTG